MDSRDVIGLLVDALGCAEGELDSLAEVRQEYDDDLQKLLDERLILIETMKRAPNSEQLRGIYAEQRDAGHHHTGDLGKIPVDKEVLRRLDETRDVLRRWAILDDDLRDALRDAGQPGWFW